ncbi:MAG: SURF1 family protein [Nevskia sp.]|nr:SURF1 family protein [Nevskia sp.]
MAWTFRPPLWAVLGTAAGCALTLYLGVWQLHRGVAKQALDRQYAAALQQPPVPLDVAAAAGSSLVAVPVMVTGQYLADRQLLLDDQPHGDTFGYHAWTPLRLADGRLLIVDRGWLPRGGDSQVLPALPAPSGALSLHGLWRSLPEPGVRLGGSGCEPAHPPANWPRTVLYPTAADLRCFYGQPVLDGELLLAPDAADGFLRDWQPGTQGFPPARHYGYAAQWFAFCLTLLALFLKLNLKRSP